MKAKYAWHVSWANVMQAATQGSGKNLKEALKPWRKIAFGPQKKKGVKELMARLGGKGGF